MNTPKEPSVLDQWEAQAKEMKALFPEAEHPNSDRILTLIDLVRKKDEALKVAIRFKKAVQDDMLESGVAEEFVNQLAIVNLEGPLALTDELGHTS